MQPRNFGAKEKRLKMKPYIAKALKILETASKKSLEVQATSRDEAWKILEEGNDEARKIIEEGEGQDLKSLEADLVILKEAYDKAQKALEALGLKKKKKPGPS